MSEIRTWFNRIEVISLSFHLVRKIKKYAVGRTRTCLIRFEVQGLTLPTTKCYIYKLRKICLQILLLVFWKKLKRILR